MVESRQRRWEAEAHERALSILALDIGDRVWYWHRGASGDPRWVEGRLSGAGAKDGYAIVDVTLEDPTLPDEYQGFTKWGYGWQVRAWSDQRPAEPTPGERYP